MAQIKNNFLQGKMNKDLDERLVPNGQYTDALNIRVSSSEGSDVGAIENLKGNTRLSFLGLANPICRGAKAVPSKQLIYFFVQAAEGNYVLEYNADTDITDIILQDNDDGNDELEFSTFIHTHNIAYIEDEERGKAYLAWTDGVVEPKFVDIEKYRANPTDFSKNEITLLRPAPIEAPALTTAVSNVRDREIDNVFRSFAYRWRYDNGQYSALSPFSEIAFLPQSFAYDGISLVNESMQNAYRSIIIGVNTGDRNVSSIEVVYKESGSNAVYVVDDINKEDKSLADNANYLVEFDSNRIYRQLPSDQLFRTYDNVPKRALAMAYAGNRLLFGNYAENYDLVDSQGNPIALDYTVGYNSYDVSTSSPQGTMRSNRDYQIAIGYRDEYGRLTTPLSSENSSVRIEPADADKQNKLEVTIANLAPEFATHYSFFLKEFYEDYDVISPTIVYEKNNIAYIKLEGDNRNAFSEGDTVIIKADKSGILENPIEVEVLEVETQTRNFLEDDPDSVTTLEQEPGLYMAIRQSGFNLISTPVSLVNFNDSLLASFNFQNNINYIEPAIRYGGGGSMTALGTYTGDIDSRFEIEVISGGAPIEFFRWRRDGGPWSLDIEITGTGQTLEDGVQVAFNGGAGFQVTGTRFVVNAKSATITNAHNSSGLGIGRYDGGNGNPGIPAGATITLGYTEQDGLNYELKFTSSADYENIQEWFYEDNVIDQFPIYPDDLGDVIFRRMDGTTNQITGLATDNMVLFIRSQVTGKTVTTTLNIDDNGPFTIIETEPTRNNDLPFYEIPGTYEVSTEGYHLDGTTEQTASVDAVVELDVFNAFTWGNGFESYKIKDVFNRKTMKIDQKPYAVIEDYRENIRRAEITWSGVFSSSTNYNALNEFNLSRVNFYDQLDSIYGGIQVLHPRDTDIVALQEDKVTKVLYGKDALFNADGTSNVTSTDLVLGQSQAYNGEFGISKSPGSFAFYNNNMYFTDARRGAVMRISYSGQDKISEYGMSDYFQDVFRDIPNATNILGCYDPDHGEYVIYNPSGTNFTVGYSEGVKGFTSFYSYRPQYMVGMNNKFYSFDNGDIWRHNTNERRNSFYGVDYDSTMTLSVNEAPSDIKILKAMNLEGNSPWGVNIRSFLNDNRNPTTISSIPDTGFDRKEGKWFAYVRGNILTNTDIIPTSRTYYGLGDIQSLQGSPGIVMESVPKSLISVGDIIYQNAVTLPIGTVTDVTDTTISFNSYINTPTAGEYIFGGKPGSVEGAKSRGYAFEVKLTTSSIDPVELFAINSDIIKSYS